MKFELYFRKQAPTRAMKLGSKGKDVESFVDQLKSEGENVITALNNVSLSNNKSVAIKQDIDE